METAVIGGHRTTVGSNTFKVLRVLDMTRGPLTSPQIARLAKMETQPVSATLYNLRKRGIVEQTVTDFGCKYALKRGDVVQSTPPKATTPPETDTNGRAAAVSVLLDIKTRVGELHASNTDADDDLPPIDTSSLTAAVRELRAEAAECRNSASVLTRFAADLEKAAALIESDVIGTGEAVAEA